MKTITISFSGKVTLTPTEKEYKYLMERFGTLDRFTWLAIDCALEDSYMFSNHCDYDYELNTEASHER